MGSLDLLGNARLDPDEQEPGSDRDEEVLPMLVAAVLTLRLLPTVKRLFGLALRSENSSLERSTSFTDRLRRNEWSPRSCGRSAEAGGYVLRARRDVNIGDCGG